MSWNCEKCGRKLKGDEKYCPECATEVVYKCKKCGKIIDNGKKDNCPLCATEAIEKRKKKMEILKTYVAPIGAGVATIGGLAIKVIKKK